MNSTGSKNDRKYKIFAYPRFQEQLNLLQKLILVPGGLRFAQETTLQRFPRLLRQVATVILGDFLPIFPLFALFHYKSRLSLPK